MTSAPAETYCVPIVRGRGKQGKIWICKVLDERKAREVEQKYRITSKQYVEGGLQLRMISEIQPELECMSVPATLEDAYIYVTNQYE